MFVTDCHCAYVSYQVVYIFWMDSKTWSPMTRVAQWIESSPTMATNVKRNGRKQLTGVVRLEVDIDVRLWVYFHLNINVHHALGTSALSRLTIAVCPPSDDVWSASKFQRFNLLRTRTVGPEAVCFDSQRVLISNQHYVMMYQLESLSSIRSIHLSSP